MKKTVATLALAGALAAPAAAGAHVTVQPSEVPAGGFTRLDVRVPNERDSAGTRKVVVRMPPGFVFVSYEPAAGWRGTVKKRKLAEPIEEHGEKITEEVASVTFAAENDGAAIAPGQFRDFGLSVGVPDRPGSTLTFKALQAYTNGEVVRWIGGPDADQPAAQVELTAAEGEHGAEAEAEAAPAAASASDDDGGSDTLAVVALVIGALGLLAGGYAAATARRAGAA